uniref:Putative secreted protein n=1 Tax=Anopheles marajoara TaxID=58244 RepID=A0A2M4C4E9_9DIPT
MSSSDSSGSSSFFSSFFSAAAGAAPPAAAPPAAGAPPPPDPTPEPMLVIRLLTSMPSRALANRPGQYGSMSTLAAFRMVEIFSSVTATSSSTRISAE